MKPEEEVQHLAALARQQADERRRSSGGRLLVGSGGCGLAVGARELADALRSEIFRCRPPFEVVEAGCNGLCYLNPQVTFEQPGIPNLTYGPLQPSQVSRFVGEVILRGQYHAFPGFAWATQSWQGLPGYPQVPFLAGQRRFLLENCGQVDPLSLDDYLARGGYRGLAKALALSPEGVIDQVKRSGLEGRGGAYFPVALKWESCRRATGETKYLVINAEEGEPGAFKDRHILEGDPYRVVEGLTIAAYALGASRAFLYVNGQAHLSQERLGKALNLAEKAGLLGESILGMPFRLNVEMRQGAGGYVLGEESVLLNSIEGDRSMPRLKPPYPTEAGLWGRPTVIHNAETLANLPQILDRGPAWCAGLGNSQSKGTKLIALSGSIARSGLLEVEMGTPLQRVIQEMGGGVPQGHTLQAVLSGGPSGTFVPPERLDLPLEPRHPEIVLGSGNLVVLDDRSSLLEMVRRLTAFNAAEACGKCAPCREGTLRMLEILDRAAAGQVLPEDRSELDALTEAIAAASLCGLGQMAPNPVTSALRFFRLPGLS